MQLETSVVKALQQVGMPIPSTRVVFSDRGGVEPASPYLLINIINSTNIGLPYKSTVHKGGALQEDIFQIKDVLVSLIFQAEGKDIVHAWVQNFQAGVHSDLVDYAFTQQGLSLVSANNIMYQSNPVSGKAYKRATLDITVRTEVQNSFSVNNLNGVNILGEFTDETGYSAGNVVVDKQI